SLPVQLVVASGVLLLGVVALWRKRRELWQHDFLRFSVILTSAYIFVLWAFNYNSYLKMWKAEAIQARYTLPVLVLLLHVMAYALNLLLLKRSHKALVLTVVLIGYVYGGGI